MKLLLTINSNNQQSLGSEAAKEFDTNGGSIGRSWDNLWVLPDPERYISSKHAQIEFFNNDFYIIDTSSNGVVIAASDQVIGNGNKHKVNNGEEFIIGDYHIQASLIHAPANIDSASAPLPSFESINPAPQATSDIDAFFGGSADPLELLGGDSDNSANQPAQRTTPQSSLLDSLAHTPAHKESMSFRPVESPAQVYQPVAPPPADYLNPSSANNATSNEIPDDWDVTGFAPVQKHTQQPENRPTYNTQNPTLSPQDFAALDDDDFFGGSNAQPIAPDSVAQTQPPAQTPIVNQAPSPVADPITSAPPLQPSLTSNETPNAPFNAPNNGASPQAQAQAIAQARSHAGQRHSNSPQAEQRRGNHNLLQQAQASLQQKNINPDFLTEEVAQHWLALMPEIMDGIVQLLQARAEIKNQFRVNKTILHAQENNPLKFSANGIDAINNLFLHTRPGFLEPKDALTQAFNDINVHQTALLHGLRHGMMDLLEGFSPSNMEQQFDKGLKRGSFLSKMNNAKYWQLYKDRYQHYQVDSDDDFQRIFGETFAKAYDQHCETNDLSN